MNRCSHHVNLCAAPIDLVPEPLPEPAEFKDADPRASTSSSDGTVFDMISTILYLCCCYSLFVVFVGGAPPPSAVDDSSLKGRTFEKFSHRFTPVDQAFVMEDYSSTMMTRMSRVERVTTLQEESRRLRAYMPAVRAGIVRRAERDAKKRAKQNAKADRKGGKGMTAKQKKRQKLGVEANEMMMETLAAKDKEERKLRKNPGRIERRQCGRW